MDGNNSEFAETGLEVAVIGMTGRFPGAANIDEFWHNLKNGVESTTFFTEEELAEAGVDPELLRHPQYVRAKAMLEDVESFDADFFDYTPREAALLDPQYRLLHECTWEAMEHAGYNPETCTGLVGLYAGASNNLYWMSQNLSPSHNPADQFQVMHLNDPSFATRLSYKLNLKGPSVSVQTACSTSLVAIHLACQGLLGGECDLALAGGVSVTLPHRSGYLYQEGMIHSPDGHCRAFDEQAGGTVFGEGVGMVVLKRLKDAVEDGDTIHAVIKGSAMNNDGNRKVGYTAPSTGGQTDVIRAAHQMAEVEPESINYIEAHGTGTVLGDPIEVEALQLAFDTDRKGYCPIGSVKSNIGHLDAAAGVAGFIKTVLALKHQQIPPSLHFHNPNPKIDFANSPFYVNTELKPWRNDPYPLRAGVSSFGLGGTNAHIVMEESPVRKTSDAGGTRPQLIPLSAKTEAALERAAGDLHQFIQDHPDVSLADLAFTLQMGRKHFKYRRAWVCADAPELAQRLSGPVSEITQAHGMGQDAKNVVFMFSGQGSPYIRMGLGLYREEPVFRREVDRCIDQVQPSVALDLKSFLDPEDTGPEQAEAIYRTDITQPLLFIFEYALAQLLKSWGIRPDAMIGHSIGEYVAACLAGVFSLEDSLRLVVLRGKLMQSRPAGAMLGVPLSEKDLRPYLCDGLSLAAVNGKAQCVVSGTHEAIDGLARRLEEEGHQTRKLRTSHAFHSDMMDDVSERLAEEVGRLKREKPSIPYISNVTGTWITGEEATDPDYWAKHLRHTVRFDDGLDALLQKSNTVFVEVGPGNTLSGLVRRHPARKPDQPAFNMVRHPRETQPDFRYLLNRVGQLWSAGVSLDFTALHDGEKRSRIPLPTYPFEKRRFPLEGKAPEGESPDTEAVSRTPARERRKPREVPSSLSDMENTITEVVKGHFGFDQVGKNENFFELGASSLDITQLASKLSGVFGREISTVTLYEYTTIHALAEHFHREQPVNQPERVQVKRSSRSSEAGGTSTGRRDGSEIAVVGMSGRFPGAKNLDEYWRNLSQGVESISFFSDEELRESGIDPALIENPNYVKAKGILEEIDLFDANFFDCSPREAEMMDPQFRMFQECAWEALENAGCDPDRSPGQIGVYAGTTPNLPWITRFASLNGTEQFGSMLLNDREFFSTYMAYKLNLKGPGVTMQTACSTSLVNMVMACQGLLTGACDVALTGGATVSLPQKAGYLYQDGMINSPDGHCRAFDEEAAGTVFGDGVGVVVLKRLEDAIADRDCIHSVIKGFGLNNDGNRKVGFTAPSVQGQAEVIRDAYKMAGFSPETITYLEAHGTGTEMGDPIEIEALKQAFGTDKTGFCRIGSVKTNVGHLNSAAGIAGLIKTVLAMKHRQIPPSLHYKKANPKIDFANSPFIVNTELTPWESDGSPRRAGVSSFGIGGTNAHVVLEEAPSLPSSGESRHHQLLFLSAKTETALESRTEQLMEYFKENPAVPLADVAYTLQVGRKPFPYRRVWMASQDDEGTKIPEDPAGDRVMTAWVKEQSRPVTFLFSGQGSQYLDMGRELYETEEVFRQEMDRCFAIVQRLFHTDLQEIMYPAAGGDRQTVAERLNRTEMAQPALFAFEYALARLLISWGIRPDSMIGHSIGEYVAACLAGVFSLEDALRLVVLRGRWMQEMPSGSMLSVPLAEENLRPYLGRETSLAAVNAPGLCTVSGPDAAIASLAEKLSREGIQSRPLHTSHAFHSHMMAPILDRFKQAVGEIPRDAPRIPFVSNMTGTWITAEEVTDPDYWARHLRGTVRFADGLDPVLRDENAVLVEVGPGNTLSTFARKHAGKQPDHVIVNLVRHPREKVSDSFHLLQKLGRLWLAGCEIDWNGFYRNEQRNLVTLPTYPFERQRYWIDEQPDGVDGWAGNRSALDRKKPMNEWFYIPSWDRTLLPPTGEMQQTEDGAWMVLDDRSRIGAELVERLRREGKQVITVHVGPAFAQRSEHDFELDPADGTQYETLCQALRTQGVVPSRILHLWGVSRESGSDENRDINRWQQRGYYSLVFLAQAVTRQQVTDECKIFVLTNQMQEVTGAETICAEKATVLGPCKVIPQEYSHIQCWSIDIDLPSAGSWREEELLGQLLAELKHPSTDRIIAYRHRHRWVQRFKPVELQKAEALPGQIRPEGVYLITGGLGSIGHILSQLLAKKGRVKLVLTGRSSVPNREEWEDWIDRHGEDEETSRKIRKVQRLESMGAEVSVMQADVSDEKRMREVVAEAERRYGRIHGVFHAAGLPGSTSFRAIEEIPKNMEEDQFQSKIYGLHVLQRVLQGKDLDFCLLFSSVASLLGGLGFSAYSAANLYMDAFVKRHNQQERVPWIGVNWDAWQFWGEHTSTLGESLAELAIQPEEGEELFEYVLAADGFHQLVVSTGDLQARIDQWITMNRDRAEGGDPSRSTSSNARPDLSHPYVEPRNQMEKTLAEIWSQFLGMDQVGIHDNFFELGASSLDIIHVTNRLNEKLGTNVAVVTLFTYPTILSLAEHLSQGEDEEDPDSEEESEMYEMMSKGKKRLRNQRKKRLKGV
ncbi:type I polyketide synthase [Paludifilum halophilum]|uniref:Phenolphthiocerol/phthiocerol polyketide synthase subunit E n=1 Tax=Paludifilum halophilum TaxID=1642702 RepID=A0A235BA27_9BACL|nr:type I polyketide synthase [Paludifilum halophilum]OYD09082.1 polyketide synthase subunit [Paludifilum halophilum]